ncbi:hypothetical protein PRZ48_005224 [Zasmidium cellare]|uniref:Uncharacterized protein n=1 Tax=Zasmidium cellare TaxID=395010 RepID=A0ABR0EU02_ZASCE|nr:hypothetical protein PRZ48_005224 [Zasmidium cellare]
MDAALQAIVRVKARRARWLDDLPSHCFLLMFIKLIIRQVRELVLASTCRSPRYYLLRILEAARTVANNLQHPATARVFSLLREHADDLIVEWFLVWAVVFDHPDVQTILNIWIASAIELLWPIYNPWRSSVDVSPPPHNTSLDPRSPFLGPGTVDDLSTARSAATSVRARQPRKTGSMPGSCGAPAIEPKNVIIGQHEKSLDGSKPGYKEDDTVPKESRCPTLASMVRSRFRAQALQEAVARAPWHPVLELCTIDTLSATSKTLATAQETAETATMKFSTVNDIIIQENLRMCGLI